MAFGFSPKHIEHLATDGLTEEQFIVIALEAVKKLNWNVSYTSRTGIIAYTKFSMSSYSEEVKITVSDSTATLKSECTGSQLIDWGKNKRNIEKFISVYNELKASLSVTELDEKFEELKPNIVAQEEDILSQPPPTIKENIANVFALFKPTKGYIITPVIIDLNIFLFLLMVISGVNVIIPDNVSLIKWGANFRPMTLEGEWWRLITNCFLHIGVFHLLLNMYALAYIGVLLEPRLGTSRFTAAYLLTGLCASVASLWWNDLTISAGASGAIFGMYGVFLAMLTTNLIERAARRALMVSIALFVGYNLLNGMKGGIDNAAHIGGLISGILIGYSFYPSLKNNASSKIKYVTIGVLTLLVGLMSVIVYVQIPNNIGKYDARMKQFISMESMALEVFKMPENSPKEKLLDEIKNRGLYYWNENIKLVSELDKMKLPEPIHRRNEKLIQYCKLRIKSYELLYKTVEENTDIYNPQLEDYNRQIEAVISELTTGK
jgi:rhomboid protease GluP